MPLFEWYSKFLLRESSFFYILKDDVGSNFKLLEKLFSDAFKISSIRSHHCFFPNADKILKIRRILGDAKYFTL